MYIDFESSLVVSISGKTNIHIMLSNLFRDIENKVTDGKIKGYDLLMSLP